MWILHSDRGSFGEVPSFLLSMRGDIKVSLCIAVFQLMSVMLKLRMVASGYWGCISEA